jgi:hypothetical protein
MSKSIPVHADIILQALADGITKLKAAFIKGMYMTGSIPLNDFHSNKSDIDFIILCNELPTTEFRAQLKNIHKTIDRKFKTKLNGCYITGDRLNVHHSQNAKTLCYQEGRLYESAFEMAPVTLYELKTTSITLAGIQAADLPIVVEISDVNKFLYQNINTYWEKWVAKHSSAGIHQLLLALFPRLSEWVILGVARQLYTLRTGKIASKTGAGYYCLKQLPATYHSIIQEAINIRNDKSRHLLSIKSSYYVQPSVKRARRTIACANYIITLFNEEYRDSAKGVL